MCKGENKRKQQQKPSASFLVSRKNLQMCWKNADKVQCEGLHAGSFWRLLGMNPRWFSIILILVGKKKNKKSNKIEKKEKNTVVSE